MLGPALKETHIRASRGPLQERRLALTTGYPLSDTQPSCPHLAPIPRLG